MHSCDSTKQSISRHDSRHSPRKRRVRICFLARRARLGAKCHSVRSSVGEDAFCEHLPAKAIDHADCACSNRREARLVFMIGNYSLRADACRRYRGDALERVSAVELISRGAITDVYPSASKYSGTLNSCDLRSFQIDDAIKFFFSGCGLELVSSRAAPSALCRPANPRTCTAREFLHDCHSLNISVRIGIRNSAGISPFSSNKTVMFIDRKIDALSVNLFVARVDLIILFAAVRRARLIASSSTAASLPSKAPQRFRIFGRTHQSASLTNVDSVL